MWLAFLEAAFEDFHAQRVEDLPLDRPLERTRAVHRIVPVVGQEFLRLVAERRGSISCASSRFIRLPSWMVDDLLEVGVRQPVEDDRSRRCG